ncbi:hydrogenase 4 subunit F [Acetobacterium bakii]|uniref:NADH-ubiquinone oxidoreductase n=1 Tax=Acetobacterium bakii TaxID=52689 RepID=A0A0L6TZV5_9FIRM|nr:hydrogenase 4 subunit F [Acetobacterium bakii]KNZ41794.1 NADH-ubiquinone oxidoreductase [Acetobacterium bakii]
MGFVLLAVPVIAVVLFFLLKKMQYQHAVSVTASIILVILGAFLTREVMLYGTVEYTALGGIFYIDALSIIVLDIVVIIGFLTSVYSIGYLEEELREGKLDQGRLRIYYILMYAFIFTMLLALTVKNIGIMWVAIEATTLSSAFLVGFYNGKDAIDAAWKYIIICSVGIGIALLGIIFLQFSSIGVVESSQFLDWTALFNNAADLKGPTLRLSFIFILVGFGTKVGLAPMHTWLPDAHSQAPSPISTLMSGVLLNGAMYGIIRIVAIINHSFGNSIFVGRIMVTVGVLSVATAAVFVFTQKDYKRMLAYSSIEHMGIIAIAIGFFTPLSIFGGLLHMINHSFTKSMLFLSTGNILQKYNTKEISKIRGMFKLLPVTATVFLLGLFAIGGAPPFSVFTSELLVISSIFQENNFLVGGLLILLIAIIFTGIVVTMFKMFYGNEIPRETSPGEGNIPGVVTIVGLLVIITAMGLYIPGELKGLIENAVKIIIGG